MFDQRWVEENAECAAGLAWGLEYVRNDPKGLLRAVEGFDRADWLLWFCAKTRLSSDAYGLAVSLVLEHMPALGGAYDEAVQLVEAAAKEGSDTVQIRADAATEAFTCAQLGKLREACAFEAAGFVALMKHNARRGEDGRALLYAQSALLSLVGAMGLGRKVPAGDVAGQSAAACHDRLCDKIRERVLAKEPTK